MAAVASPHRNAVLNYAWQVQQSYSDAANNMKTRSQRLRLAVIWLIFLTSVLAVVLSLPPINEWVLLLPATVQASVRAVIRVLLVVLPAVTIIVLRIANDLAPLRAWVNYRVQSECVRREVYLYRTRAGDYTAANPDQVLRNAVDRLRAELRAASIDEPLISGDPNVRPTSEAERVYTVAATPKTDDREHDDGFSPLGVQEYIDWRLIPQRDWYYKKIDTDKHKLNRTRIWTYVVGGLGALFGGLGAGLELWVVITTALAVMIRTRSQLFMFGHTYRNYSDTYNGLRAALLDWQLLTDDQRASEEAGRQFILAVEEIFKKERDTWMEQAMRAQVESEQLLTEGVDVRDNDFERPVITTTSTVIDTRGPAAPDAPSAPPVITVPAQPAPPRDVPPIDDAPPLPPPDAQG